MEDNETQAAPVAADDTFDLSAIDSADEAEMEVIANGKPTGWMIRFAGPGHPQTVKFSNEIAKERLHRDRMIEQAQANGRKYKAPVETVDEARARNVNLVVARMLGWSPIKMNGQDYPFTAENAKTLLLDPRKGQLLLQCLEFIGADDSFSRPSQNG